MNRLTFAAGLGALAGLPRIAESAAALGHHTTLDEVLASVPPVSPRSWVQYIMGSGVVYSKKIGVGREHSSLGLLPFIETQIGDAQATCNPNTIKKAYIGHPQYGGLLPPHDVRLYVVKAGTAFSILNTDASDKLYLLDADNLYSRAPARVIASGADRVRVRTHRLATRRIELAFANAGPQSLQTLTLWVTPRVPFGIAKMHATLAGTDPFDLRVDSFGDAYFSLVPDSLDTLRKNSA